MEKNSKLLIFDLDKLNLVILGYGGLILDSGQFSQLPQLPQKWLKNDYIALLI